MKEYDDPYLSLAYHLIARLGRGELKRVLFDNDFVRNTIIKEVRQVDMPGLFLDTITQDILDKKERMELMHELDKLALYFFKKLDLARLRKEISEICTRYNILEV